MDDPAYNQLCRLLEPLAQGNLRATQEQGEFPDLEPQLLQLVAGIRRTWLNERNETLDQGVKTLEQLMQAKEDLSTSQGQLQHAIRLNALGTLAAGIAHEMSQPLTVILGYCDLLRSELKDTTSKERVQKISAASETLAKVLDNVLTFSRRGGFELESATSHEPLRRAIALVENTFAMDQIELALDLGVGPVELPIHQGRIQQVLVNLLTNARDALAALSASEQKVIQVQVLTRDAYLIYRISNNGPPIDADIAGKLFDPFFTTKQPGAGMGLGLAVSHGIVKEHKGYIRHFWQQPWTSFEVGLPLAADQPEG